VRVTDPVTDRGTLPANIAPLGHAELPDKRGGVPRTDFFIAWEPGCGNSLAIATPSPRGEGKDQDRVGQGLATPLQFIKGVGPARAKLLAKVGLETIEDALFCLPSRHEDRSQLTALGRVAPGDAVTCAGTIRGVSPPPHGRSRAPLSVLLGD